MQTGFSSLTEKFHCRLQFSNKNIFNASLGSIGIDCEYGEWPSANSRKQTSEQDSEKEAERRRKNEAENL